ncbi:MAG: NYN domain-containing protein [Candidatus Sericytochromatia bacterium]|nr:NYN domain-containing protein [Candidatus Tanganyikabacteria bacterium]
MSNPARCALFVDHENIWLSLKQAYGQAIGGEEFAEDLAQALKECCQAKGELEYWAAVADWTKGDFASHAKAYNRYAYEVILNFTGPNNADLKIQGAIMDLMNRRPEIDTYIIATGDKGFQPTLQRIVHSGKHAVIWGVRGATNQTLQTFASDFEHLDKLLADLLRDAAANAGRTARPGVAGQSRPGGTGPMRSGAPRTGNGLGTASEAVPGSAVATRRATEPIAASRPRSLPVPLIEPRDRAGTLSTLDALVVYADYYMKANHFAFFTFAKFLDFLNGRGLVGLSDEEREMWLKSAVNTEIFNSEEIRLTDHHTGEAKTIRRFRLADENARVAEARGVIEHVLKFLADTLTGPFNPSFSKLRDQLQTAIPDLQIDRVHNWLSWLKETNVLLTKEVPHKRDPAIKVKLVRLNPEHFLVKHLAAGPYAGPEELLVCVVDSHLIEHGHAWMAASKLLERIADKLASDGRPPAEARKEAKEILDAAKADRLVRVAKPSSLAPDGEDGSGDEEGGYFPSMDLGMPTAPPPASQVYLERQHARVAEILDRRNGMVRLMHESLRGRAWIARSTYQREVGALFAPPAGEDAGEGDPRAPEVGQAPDATVQDAPAAGSGEAGRVEGGEAPEVAEIAGDAPDAGKAGPAGPAAHELVHFWINLLTYLRIFLPRQVPNPRGGTTNALMLNPSSRVAAEALAGFTNLAQAPEDGAAITGE